MSRLRPSAEHAISASSTRVGEPWEYVGENIVRTTFDCIFLNARRYESDRHPLNWVDVRVIGPEKYLRYQGVHPIREDRQ